MWKKTNDDDVSFLRCVADKSFLQHSDIAAQLLLYVCSDDSNNTPLFPRAEKCLTLSVRYGGLVDLQHLQQADR